MLGIAHIAVETSPGIWDVHETCPWTLAMHCQIHKDNAAGAAKAQVDGWPEAEHKGLTEDEVKAIPSDKILYIHI